MKRIILALALLSVSFAPIAGAADTAATLVSPDGKSAVLVLRSATSSVYCAYVNDISSAASPADAERIGTAAPYNALAVPPGTAVSADTANAVNIQCSGVKLRLIPIKSTVAAFKPLAGKPGYVPPESLKLP